jgi:hypothetical protein
MLQRSVYRKFVTRVRTAIQGYVEEGVLVKNDRIVSFNTGLAWHPELRALLRALAAHLPEVVKHVEMQKEVRSWTGSGTAHASGQVFRVFGSRVNQAILCYLAVFGPTRIMKLCADISAVNPGAVDPLIEAGLVCCIDAPGSRSKYKVALNADYPVYGELRAYLRSAAIVEDSLPLLDTKEMYGGPDGYETRPFADFNPNMLFGTLAKDVAATALALIAQSPSEWVRLSGLCRLMNDYHATAVRKALSRLEDEGLVVERRLSRGLGFGLNPRYAAYGELKALLVAMGREWKYFAGAPVTDPSARCAVAG